MEYLWDLIFHLGYVFILKLSYFKDFSKEVLYRACYLYHVVFIKGVLLADYFSSDDFEKDKTRYVTKRNPVSSKDLKVNETHFQNWILIIEKQISGCFQIPRHF